MKTGLDVKGAGRVEHPFESLGYDSGCRQRYAVAGNNKTGIAVGTAGADAVFFSHRDMSAQFIEIIAAANADGAAADYKCLGLMVHDSILLDSGAIKSINEVSPMVKRREKIADNGSLVKNLA